jgi:hypothetical protein
MKKLFTQLGFYAAIVLFDMILLSVLAHVNLLKNAVYIYAYRMLYYTVFCGVLLAALCILSRAVLKKHGNQAPAVLEPPVFIPGLIIATLFLAFFIFAGPVNIDRSYTIFSLSGMADNPERVYTRKDIEDLFIKTFIYENDNITRRIDEQTHIGNMEIVTGENGPGYKISPKGRHLIGMMRFVESFYPVDVKNSIYPNGETKE